MAIGKTLLTVAVVILVSVFAGLLAWSIIGSRGERPQYTVVASEGAIEIRDYPSMIVAEVETSGARKEAITKGFKILAGYIFGDNTSRSTVAMTAPVTQQSGENIAMTAPVTQEQAGDQWRVRFMMPSAYNMQSLPKPNNPNIRLKEVPQKRFVAIQFSGLPTEQVLREKLAELENSDMVKKLVLISEPTYAFFNPPWTLPPLRRTEIMIEVEK